MEDCWGLNRVREQGISEGPFLNASHMSAMGNECFYKLVDTLVLSCA